jgi:hypothetical protein
VSLIAQLPGPGFVVADLFEYLPHPRLIDIVIQFIDRSIALLVPQAYVPTVRQRVVVIATLLFVDIDSHVIDQTIR